MPFSQILRDAAVALSRFWNFRTQAEQTPSESRVRDLGGESGELCEVRRAMPRPRECGPHLSRIERRRGSLVLLIVFMVAAPLMTSGIPVDLPKIPAKQTQRPETADRGRPRRQWRLLRRGDNGVIGNYFILSIEIIAYMLVSVHHRSGSGHPWRKLKLMNLRRPRPAKSTSSAPSPRSAPAAQSFSRMRKARSSYLAWSVSPPRPPALRRRRRGETPD